MATPITKAGFARLSAELETLKTVERPAIIRAIAEARAHGDLKENAEYHSAKDKQGMIEARIKMLAGALAGAEVLDPAKMPQDGRCVLGAFVDLQKEGGGKMSYQLVGAVEADLDAGRLSSASPLGKALLGKKKGDAVYVETPDGELEYTLLAVTIEGGETAEAAAVEKTAKKGGEKGAAKAKQGAKKAAKKSAKKAAKKGAGKTR